MAYSANFFFYGSLNDFLPRKNKDEPYEYEFAGTPSVKDAIETIGVPHVEVDLILANECPVDFTHRLSHSDKILVYPKGLRPEAQHLIHLIQPFPGEPAFVLDVHLGKLARLLRMLGFDILYEKDFADAQIAAIAVAQTRIVLTRDLPLLKRKTIEWGYWLRPRQPHVQLWEVIHHFDLLAYTKPFYRCITCNGLIVRVDKEQIQDELQPQTKACFHEFYQCTGCRKIYWKGSHYEKMEKFIQHLHHIPVNNTPLTD
jgi:uncharacterized protein with PIN domain